MLIGSLGLVIAAIATFGALCIAVFAVIGSGFLVAAILALVAFILVAVAVPLLIPLLIPIVLIALVLMTFRRAPQAKGSADPLSRLGR